MSTTESIHIVGSRAAERKILGALRGRFHTTSERPTRGRILLLDTFDWRVERDGGRLIAAPIDGGHLLTWTRRDGGFPLRATVSELPAFSAELPDGPLSMRLGPLLSMRRLLPLAELDVQTTTLHILDEETKTTVQVHLERGSVVPHGPLPALLRVVPLLGYESAGDEVRAFLAAEFDLELTHEDLRSRALTAVGLTPGDYRPNDPIPLLPETPSAHATRIILRSLFATVRANEDGLRADLDSEFLHDQRVAIRRTRSALSQIKGVLAPSAVKKFKDEFRWLGRTTAKLRDLDVYLIKCPSYAAQLPAADRDDLGPLRAYLTRHQKLEHARVAKVLASKRYLRLLSSWEEFLSAPDDVSAATPNAARAVLELASERIWKVFTRVIRDGSAIRDDSPDAALHDLRIECKKLRYLVSFFQSLYPPAKLAAIIAALKRLQDSLGNFNDCSVQQEQLRTYTQEMLAEGLGGVETFTAMGRLAQIVACHQREERRQFGERFAAFASNGNQKLFKKLFRR